METGRCLCGEIEFGVEGQPNNIINCHCKFCQRATGSAYLVETMFDKENFHLLRGATQVYDHVSQGSGKVIHIHFCGTCGTKTHMLFDRFPASVGVFSGTFDNKDWFERTRENALHFFLSMAPRGTVLPAGFKIYDAHFWQSEGLSSTPVMFDENTVVTDELKAESVKRLRNLNT